MPVHPDGNSKPYVIRHTFPAHDILPHHHHKSRNRGLNWARSFHFSFAIWIVVRPSRLAFRGCKFLDLFAKFADGFAVAKAPLMPCCIILRRTTHHHDKPFCVKITEVVNKSVETFGSKLVVWNHCHDWSSLTKSTGLAIRIPPNSCNFFVIPLSVVRNQSQEAASNIFHRPTFHHRLYAHLGHGFKMNAQIRLRADSCLTSRSRAYLPLLN